MTRPTDRRAVLGAVIAAGAAATLPTMAATKELTESDRQVIERWVRYRALCGRHSRAYAQIDDLSGKLPDIRPNEKEVRVAHEERRHKIRMEEPGGSDASMLRTCREIEQAHLDGRLVDDPGLVNGAKSWRRRFMRFQEDDPKILAAIAAFDENDRQLAVDLAACKARNAAHEAKRERLGLASLEEECEQLYDELSDLNCEILSSELRSPHALASAIIVKIDDTDDETADVLRASLAVIRPQLVGLIAEEADRVLAQADEEEDA
jgi:hypothetical protein